MVCVKSQLIHGGRRGQKEGHLSFPLKLLLSETGKKKTTFFPACFEEGFICVQVRGESVALMTAPRW